MKKKLFLPATILFALFSSCTNQPAERKTEDKELADKIIALEKAALEEWNKGNPNGYLKNYTEDVTYFDPFLEKRVDGFAEIERLYKQIEGQVSVEKYEMINPAVQSTENMAILTYNLNSYSGDKLYQWNCTEVFRLETSGQWKIAHVHWSLVKPIQ